MLTFLNESIKFSPASTVVAWKLWPWLVHENIQAPIGIISGESHLCPWGYESPTAQWQSVGRKRKPQFLSPQSTCECWPIDHPNAPYPERRSLASMRPQFGSAAWKSKAHPRLWLNSAWMQRWCCVTGKTEAFGGCDSRSPSLCHRRTRLSGPPLSTDRFEQRLEPFGRWSSIWASGVWFGSGRHPSRFFRHFSTRTKTYLRSGISWNFENICEKLVVVAYFLGRIWACSKGWVKPLTLVIKGNVNGKGDIDLSVVEQNLHLILNVQSSLRK